MAQLSRAQLCTLLLFLSVAMRANATLPVQAQAQGFTAMCPPLGAVAVLVFALPAAPASKPISVAAGSNSHCAALCTYPDPCFSRPAACMHAQLLLLTKTTCVVCLLLLSDRLSFRVHCCMGHLYCGESRDMVCMCTHVYPHTDLGTRACTPHSLRATYIRASTATYGQSHTRYPLFAGCRSKAAWYCICCTHISTRIRTYSLNKPTDRSHSLPRACIPFCACR